MNVQEVNIDEPRELLKEEGRNEVQERVLGGANGVWGEVGFGVRGLQQLQPLSESPVDVGIAPSNADIFACFLGAGGRMVGGCLAAAAMVVHHT